MRLFLSLALCLVITHISAQQCHRATWVKTNGGINSGENVLDVEQHPLGGFVECGSFPMQGLVRGTESIPAGVGGFYMAQVDSAGVYSNLTAILPSGYVNVKRIAVLADGSVAVVCNLLGNFTLGSETFDVHGGARSMLVKFDANFNYQWHTAAANTNNSQDVRDIATDSEGNIYWGGIFDGDYMVLGSLWLYKNNGKAWLSKVSPTGQVQWLNQLGSINSTGMQTLSVDSEDNVWITGTTTLPATGVFKFSQQYTVNGFLNSSYSFYVGKYHSDGTCAWGQLTATAYTSNHSMYAWDAKGGADGSMYICGKITGQHHLGSTLLFGDDGSGFLMKMQSDGACEWFKTMGGQGSYEEVSRLDYRNGKIAVFGYLSSNQPYIGDFPAYSMFSLSADHFNANFYEDGSLEFARTYDAGSQEHYPVDVVLDEDGRQMMFGSFKATQTWYPVTLTQSGSVLKNYIAKFDNAVSVAFTVSAGPDKTTTCGVNVQLNGSTTPSNVDFGWYPSLGFSGNNTKTPNVAPTAPGSYIFYGYYQGCVKTDTVNVTLSNYDLTLEIPEEETICVGETLMVDAITNHPEATFVWTPNYRMTSTTAASTGIFTNTEMMYVVEATYNSCKARDTLHVDAQALPYIYVPYSQFYQGAYQMHTCLDNSITVDLGVPENTYFISAGIDSIWQSTHEITFIADSYSQFATITATSPAGCVSSIPVTVYGHEYISTPPITEQPTDTIYVCPAAGLVHEETIMITSDYEWDDDFQYSWYPGWQVDSLDGLGWRDIPVWEYAHYRMSALSWGENNSTYYTDLELWNVHPEMDGFKFRAYVSDICSERAYTEEMVLRVGPAIESQSDDITICEGASDSLFVQSTSNTSSYQWEVFRNDAWEIVVSGEDNILIDENVLYFTEAFAGMDSLFRCRTAGCLPELYMYSEEIHVNVQASDLQSATPIAEPVCPFNDGLIILPLPSGNYTLQWYADDVAIVDNINFEGATNDSLTIYSITETLAQAIYKCRITSEQCGQDVYSETISIELLAYTQAVWENELATICANVAPVALTDASPAGGEYGGTGVEGNMFDAGIAGAGEHVLSYSYYHLESGCQSYVIQTIEVFAQPQVQFSLLDNMLCTNEDALLLTGATPAEGTYSGEFVTTEDLGTYYFETPFAFTGGHEIIFTHTDENGCTASAIDSLFVNETTAVSWIDDLGFVCIGEENSAVQMPEPVGGNFIGVEIIDGIVNSEQLPAGDYDATYSYTNELGCVTEATAAIHFQGVNALWILDDTTFCQNDNVLMLTGGEPSGGEYNGDGISEGYFDPSQLTEGNHVLTYTYTDELSLCSDIETVEVYVAATPSIEWLADFGEHCLGDSSLFIANASPAGGAYSGGDIVDGYLQFASLGTGTQTLNYAYTSDFGCYADMNSSITINDSPEVLWIPANGSDFSICVNLETEVDLTQYVSVQGGMFSSDDITIDGSTWTGLPSTVEGIATIAYSYTDPNTNCTIVTQQDFEMVLCFGVKEVHPKPIATVQNGNELTISHTRPLQITLHNTLGQIVMANKMTDNKRTWILNVANAAYFVQLNDGVSSWVEKIVVQK